MLYVHVGRTASVRMGNSAFPLSSIRMTLRTSFSVGDVPVHAGLSRLFCASGELQRKKSDGTMGAVSPLEGCTETCGWIAAVIAVVGFGSFGVPVKSDSANKVNIDPLVMQTYKGIMCFILSFTVLCVGVEFSFTPWGIVSGLFWVPGGTAAIYGIRNAGLALTAGLSSSLIVLVSFTWGIFIFHEPVKSRLGASLSVVIMICGICGMAYFSQPNLPSHDFHYYRKASSDEFEETYVRSSGENETTIYSEIEIAGWQSNRSTLEMSREHAILMDLPFIKHSNHPVSGKEDYSLRRISLWPIHCSRRTFGVLCAIFNGVWGGSIMVPMHYSGSATKGIGYVISFGIGQFTVTIALWILRYLYYLYQNRCNFYQAYCTLPSWHLKEMWRAGCLCGSLWEIANMGSIVAVQFLGVGVGYSVVQSAFLVSGVWGIFWFREIRGLRAIILWLACALLTVSGVLLLTYEHGTS